MSKVNFFWFRRDLRWDDNHGLFQALKSDHKVVPVFIFDQEILENLESSDRRVNFIYQEVENLKKRAREHGGDLVVRYGKPYKVWQKLVSEFAINAVYVNSDYEPAATARDEKIKNFLASQGINFLSFKDQCLFEKDEILSGQGKSYTVFTPYKKNVLSKLGEIKTFPSQDHLNNLAKIKSPRPPTLAEMNFKPVSFDFPPRTIPANIIKNYEKTRNFPALENGTSHLGMHLRFGTVSVRELAKRALKYSDVWLSELIWRDFFMQILWHFPRVEKASFRPAYDNIAWRKSAVEFRRWCQGETGYPMVDAGMRELNATGFMHNRVRMVTASFLTKHLLMYWYQGERYFAKELLDYDLAANNGNWQWAAGTGCDAAPYFRVFNPQTQLKKFDPDEDYVKKWIPELGTNKYPQPMVEHSWARARALHEYSAGLRKEKS